MNENEMQKTIHENYAAFVKLLPDLLDDHAGKFVLMRNGEIVEFFDSARDAFVFGEEKFDDGLFSVQEVLTTAADLGWYSRAPAHTTV